MRKFICGVIIDFIGYKYNWFLVFGDNVVAVKEFVSDFACELDEPFEDFAKVIDVVKFAADVSKKFWIV